MIKNYKQVEMDLTIHGVAKPYFVDADMEFDFEQDEDGEVWIKNIAFHGGIVVDKYNDDWQFEIVLDRKNSLYTDLINQIKQAIEEKEAENLCDEFIIEQELSAW